MAVDTRLKRQSATCILVPSMLSGVFPDTAGVVAAERAAVSWMYSGLSLSGIVRVTSDLTVVYDMQSRVMSDLTALFDITNSVTSDLTVLYDMEARVQSDLTALFDIRGIVDSDLTVIYDMAGKVNSDLTVLYDILSEGGGRGLNRLGMATRLD